VSLWVKSLDELNQLLLDGCHAEEQRQIAGKPHTLGEAMRIEREHLLPLPTEGFELAETSFPIVDGKGCVKVRTNCYSTPLKAGTHTRVKLLPAYVEFWQERELVALHERRIQLIHIQPGRSMQNGQVESFNGRLRD
jgi:hypothetical protein